MKEMKEDTPEEKMKEAFYKAKGEKEKPDITTELVKKMISDCDELTDISPEELKEGIEVEMEHFDTVEGEMIVIAKIAADHIKEYSNYYPTLKKMESELDEGESETEPEEKEEA